MTNRELFKRLAVYGLLVGGAWMVLVGVLWAGGWKALAYVAGLVALVLALVWAWRRAAYEESKQDAVTRENHRKLVARYNAELLKRPNGKRSA